MSTSSHTKSNVEYLCALIDPNHLTDAQIQDLRSEAHALGDHAIDALCAEALDGSTGAQQAIQAFVRIVLIGN